jgi:hypothetical protein
VRIPRHAPPGGSALTILCAGRTFATNYAHGTNVPAIYCSVVRATCTAPSVSADARDPAGRGQPRRATARVEWDDGRLGAVQELHHVLVEHFQHAHFRRAPYQQPFGEYSYEGSTCVPVQVLLVPA